jgi:dephospho-CoA kinase
MIVVGLTGSIGMGKSTAAAHLRARGLPVFDADAEVHRLYAGGKAVERIERAFPGTTTNSGVDRQKLSAALVAHPGRLRELEAIVHPMVREAERSFLRAEARRGASVAVLEIPLLYETGLDRLVDAVIVLTAPAEVQRERLLQRPGMSPEKLAQLLARQMPDAEKRARADFVIDTGDGFAASEAALDSVISSLQSWAGVAYARDWA